jgi:hypothetical protein
MSFQFEEGSGFSAFALYNAIKLHFTSDSYDFFKYNGKTNVSKQTFTTRKDKYSFYKLSRKYNNQDLQQFYIANFLEKDIHWVGEIANQEGEDNYRKWQTRNQRLTYQFEQDIMYLFNKYEPKDLISVVDDFYPRLLEETMQGNIMLETLVIMNDVMGFFPMWAKKIKDDIIWPSWKRKVEKYTPFVQYDKVKFKNIMKESLKEHA